MLPPVMENQGQLINLSELKPILLHVITDCYVTVANDLRVLCGLDLEEKEVVYSAYTAVEAMMSSKMISYLVQDVMAHNLCTYIDADDYMISRMVEIMNSFSIVTDANMEELYLLTQQHKPGAVIIDHNTPDEVAESIEYRSFRDKVLEDIDILTETISNLLKGRFGSALINGDFTVSPTNGDCDSVVITYLGDFRVNWFKENYKG